MDSGPFPIEPISNPMPRLVLVVLMCLAAPLVGAVGFLFGVVSAQTLVGLGMLGGLMIGVLVVAASAMPGLQLFGPAIVRGDHPRHVCLTFDDGPDPSSTPALLEALRAHQAKATFFVLLDRAEAYPELLRAIAAEHEVGLHGSSHHPWLTVWSPKRGAAELAQASARLAELVGKSIHWFRPPFGVTSPRLVASVAAAGLQTVWCSIRTRDGAFSTQARLLSACERVAGGDIVLMHEGPRPARLALGEILDRLIARGLQPVTVGQLLKTP